MNKYCDDGGNSMNDKENIETIKNGKAVLGIELGSTRIKAVLINGNFETLAKGSFTWENKLVNGIWTYSIEDVWKGIQAAYAELSKNITDKYGILLTRINSIGISAMMHGYLAFDKNEKLLVPFRTWRNNIT